MSLIPAGSYRALRALLCFMGALAVLGIAMAADAQWFDALYVVVVISVIVALSLRVIFSKARGDGSMRPLGWQRWMRDDYPRDDSSDRDKAR